MGRGSWPCSACIVLPVLWAPGSSRKAQANAYLHSYIELIPSFPTGCQTVLPRYSAFASAANSWAIMAHGRLMTAFFIAAVLLAAPGERSCLCLAIMTGTLTSATELTGRCLLERHDVIAQWYDTSMFHHCQKSLSAGPLWLLSPVPSFI